MQALGYSLITGAFLFGSYLTVERAEGVSAPALLLTLAAGAAGVAMVRIAIHRAATSEEVLTANIGTIETSLQRVLEKIEALERDKESIDVYELRHHIDRLFPDDLDAFVQARESIAHSFGLQAYADVMNPFAAGERYLNRVWSTSTDGYVDEAHAFLTQAKEQFQEAASAFHALRRNSSDAR